jgi:hypothetical protein
LAADLLAVLLSCKFNSGGSLQISEALLDAGANPLVRDKLRDVSNSFAFGGSDAVLAIKAI